MTCDSVSLLKGWPAQCAEELDDEASKRCQEVRVRPVRLRLRLEGVATGARRKCPREEERVQVSRDCIVL